MAKPRPVQSVKLFCGLLSSDVDLLARAKQLLKRSLGEIDLESDLLDFNETEYYEEEMGPGLKRQFVSFDKLASPGVLAGAKHETNAIEQTIAHQCGGLDVARPVNLDPGYVAQGKLILATTKDRAHRIYIGQNMYAEVTLWYSARQWQISPWTYADYRRQDYHEFFSKLRLRLREQLRDVPPELDENES